MAWNELGPLIVSVGGVITALAAWLKVRHGEGNKRIEADVRSKELRIQADLQDNTQVMELVHFQQAMLDKHQARLEELQYIMETKAEQEAENRAELRLMSYQIAECEQDRTRLRIRIRRLEDRINNTLDPPTKKPNPKPEPPDL